MQTMLRNSPPLAVLVMRVNYNKFIIHSDKKKLGEHKFRSRIQKGGIIKRSPSWLQKGRQSPNRDLGDKVFRRQKLTSDVYD